MTTSCKDRGFTLLETLVSMAVVLLTLAGVYSVFVHNSRINKSQRLTAAVQVNARSALSLVIHKLRNAGWDPMNAGISAVALDPDPGDAIDQIEIFADLDMDGLTDGDREQILLRHRDGMIEWRSSNDVSAPFTVLASNISNDSDGDDVVEPMFVPDSTTDPIRLTIRVTSESPIVDPVSGNVIRYTVESQVVLRKRLENP